MWIRIEETRNEYDKGEGERGKEREGLRIKNHLCNACSFTFNVIN